MYNNTLSAKRQTHRYVSHSCVCTITHTQSLSEYTTSTLTREPTHHIVISSRPARNLYQGTQPVRRLHDTSPSANGEGTHRCQDRARNSIATSRRSHKAKHMRWEESDARLEETCVETSDQGKKDGCGTSYLGHQVLIMFVQN